MGKRIGSALELAQIATPANPAAGATAIYVKSDGNLYKKSSAGVETAIGGGGSSYTTSASLAADITDETGSGSLVFGTAPVISPAAPSGTTSGTVTTSASTAGYIGMPQASTTTGALALDASHAGKHVYSTASRTVTIPANSAMAYEIGTTISFIAASGATVTIAITTDTLLLAGTGTGGAGTSRTLAPHGMATAVKVAATTWYISGNGLT